MGDESSGPDYCPAHGSPGNEWPCPAAVESDPPEAETCPYFVEELERRIDDMKAGNFWQMERDDPSACVMHEFVNEAKEGSAVPEADRSIMHVRLSAMAAPRHSDDEDLARLRANLRDQQLMTRVTTAVDQWPPLTDEQREVLAALLTARHRREPPTAGLPAPALRPPGSSPP